jgi:hypothetical protein
VNWKPNKTVTLRSEVRWDWSDNAGVPLFIPVTFTNGRNDQFLWGNDLIVRF